MSSTGFISKVITPTTKTGESNRQSESTMNAFPGVHEQVRTTIGVVTQIHPEKSRFVKAYSKYDGATLANGDWIELNHSAQEIAERWGTVRRGFKIKVSYTGPSGAGADGTIIGTEKQDIEEPPQPNEAARGMYAIFTPGIGIG